MLYDDIQQLEVRYVISLEYHDVDVYAGGESIPEGDLWVKRHCIRLKRKKTQIGDKPASRPFFLFGQSLSDKEDFYYAILKNQEKSITEDPPVPQMFDVNHAVLLVQKLHSSEEHLQTRWLNAIIGRLFLGVYRTPELEGYIREKLTKKISRVKKPTLITKLGLRSIDLGTSAPFFTNPRLKDLTVDGDCLIEADINYTGGLKIEIAATARLDLGTRFKAREVDMVLAASCKKLQGHVLVRCKPPPSNRLWFTFEKMPQLDLHIEPIVSSRQITYSFILRTIESRIREVFAESIVNPFWDDVPFFDTRHQKYRGGIWKRDTEATTTEIPDEEPEDAAEADSSGPPTPAELLKDEKMMSMPSLADTNNLGKANAAKRSMASLNDIWGKRKAEPVERPDTSTPRLLRSTSFANAADPTITANHADANTPTRHSGGSALNQESVATMLKDISARTGSSNPSNSDSPAGTPPAESAMATAMRGRTSSNTSGLSEDGERDRGGRRRSSSPTRTLTEASQGSLQSSDMASDLSSSRPVSAQGEKRPPNNFASAAKSLTSGDRKQALASVNAAAAAAQKWGWGVLARNKQREAQVAATKAAEGSANGSSSPREPMGRGRPLPPPGMPLPPPEKLKTNSFLAPKRRPVPPPMLPKRPDAAGQEESGSARPSPKPPLPDRRKRQSTNQTLDEDECEVLVVEAPLDSAPTSPLREEHHDEFFGHGELTETPDENLKPPSLRDQSDEADEPVAAGTEESAKPALPARIDENDQHIIQEVAEVHTRPPLPARKTSEPPPPYAHEGEEMHRQATEMGMYT